MKSYLIGYFFRLVEAFDADSYFLLLGSKFFKEEISKVETTSGSFCILFHAFFKTK